MVELRTVIYIVIGLLSVGGAVVGFFQMQTRQNMEIKQLRKEIEDLKHKQSEASHYQIKTEKDIVGLDKDLKAVDKKIDTLLSLVQGLIKSNNGNENVKV